MTQPTNQSIGSALHSLPAPLKSLALVLAIALVNYISGRLGLLLALPPGFATAVWPPSGIALAAVLLCGYRVWPGVWLGSFLLNIFIANQGAPSADWTPIYMNATAIAVGSSIQAVVGAWLIRRFVGLPAPLLFERNIAMFLLLGGPVSCLIAATVGVSTLVISGVMPSSIAPFQWWTWWVGDTIGVLTLTPLVMIAFAQPREVWRARRLPVGVPLIIAFTITIVFFVYASRSEHARLEASSVSQTTQLVSAMRANLDRKVDLLRGVAGLFEADRGLSRDQFRRFIEPILPAFAGTQGVGWNPRVSPDQRLDFELAARADGIAGFEFYEMRDGVRQTASERENHFPAYYLEPQQGNEAALGFDLYSNEARRLLLDRARDSGEPTASAPIQLVQETGQQRGVLIAHPVYDGLTPPDNVTERRAKLTGFAVIVLRIGDLVEDVVDTGAADQLAIALYDADAPEANRELLAPSFQGGPAAQPNGDWKQFPLRMANRNWQLRVAPAEAATRSLVAWAALAGGLLFTSLLGAFLLAVTGRTMHVGRLVADAKTSLVTLQNTQEQLVHAEKLASLGSLVAGIAHEINTPIGNSLVSISTLSDSVRDLRKRYETNSMRRSDLDRFVEVSEEATEIALRNLQRAAELVNSFKQVAVDQSSGERRKIVLQPYIESVLMSLRPQLKKTKHSVVIDCPQELEIDTYPGAMAQVITNLVVNSLTHAFEPEQEGVMTITADEHNGRLRIRFKDDGRGIPEDKHRLIFEPFYTTKRHQGGSGLGLHILHNLVHGPLAGTVTVTSKMGQGTEFHFDLPMSAPVHRPAPPPDKGEPGVSA